MRCNFENADNIPILYDWMTAFSDISVNNNINEIEKIDLKLTIG